MIDHRLRIAFVVHRFGTGGQERCISALVNALPSDSVTPLVVSFDDRCEASEWIERDDIEVISLGKRFPNDPRLCVRLTKLLRKRQIDIAHSHNWGSLLETGIACKMTGTKHVHAEHGLEFGHRSTGFRSKFKPMLKRLFFRRADALVAIANCVQDRLRSVYGIDENRISLIPNGVTPPPIDCTKRAYKEVRNRLGIPDNSVIAGTVGRAVDVKGFDQALAAFAQIEDRDECNHLVFVGDGPNLAPLRTQAKDIGISDHVHFIGHSHEVGFWLAGFDLFFNSSRSEAMNLSILEAMSFGLPIVAMDVGDNSVMVKAHGDCGAIVDAANIVEFARSLSDHFRDPELRRYQGDMSSAVFQANYTIDRMVKGYHSLYKQLCSIRCNASKSETALGG